MNDQVKPLRSDARRNRRRVLRAAEELLGTQGTSTSMRSIAEHADVGLGTIYRQFPTKEALFEAILVEQSRELLGFGRGLTDAEDAGAALFALFTRVVADSTVKKPLLEALAAAEVDIEAEMGEIKRDMLAVIEALLHRAKDAGTVRSEVTLPQLLALMISASLGAANQQWDVELRDATLTVIYDGLRTRAA